MKVATLVAMASVTAAQAQMPPAQAMTGGATLAHPEVAPITATHGGYDGSWSGGAELLYLKPRFGGNPAFLLHTDNGTIDNHTQTDFTHDYNTAPRVWVGFGEQGKVGVRGQYFKFDDNADQLRITDATGAGAGTANVVVQTAAPGGLGFFSTGNGAVPTVLTFDSGLSMKAADFEATWASDPAARARWLFSGGLRYAEIDQTYFATEVTQANFLTSLINSRKTFDGVGPTVAAETRVALGDGGLSMYGNGRASIVFGTANQNVLLGAVPTGARGAFSNAFSSDDAMPIGEIELGLEWRKNEPGRSWFVQGGVAAQTWFGAGNAGNVEDLAPRAGVGGGTVNRQGEVDQASSDADVSLVGFKIAGGIKF